MVLAASGTRVSRHPFAGVESRWTGPNWTGHWLLRALPRKSLVLKPTQLGALYGYTRLRKLSHGDKGRTAWFGAHRALQRDRTRSVGRGSGRVGLLGGSRTWPVNRFCDRPPRVHLVTRHINRISGKSHHAGFLSVHLHEFDEDLTLSLKALASRVGA